jgi:hypothetical protein
MFHGELFLGETVTRGTPIFAQNPLMARKTDASNPLDSPEQVRFKEKRKWQIALRRYVLDRNPCTNYAPYFGLDNKTIRGWFEMQFSGELSWDNFGKKWQFTHILPVAFFDFEEEEDLKLCWNFTNLGVEQITFKNERSAGGDLLLARSYFEALFQSTGYYICQRMLDKIQHIEEKERLGTGSQSEFLHTHGSYLSLLSGFSSYEFELLNSGADILKVRQEADILRNLGK